jgi:hypothetical protein
MSGVPSAFTGVAALVVVVTGTTLAVVTGFVVAGFTTVSLVAGLVVVFGCACAEDATAKPNIKHVANNSFFIVLNFFD